MSISTVLQIFVDAIESDIPERFRISRRAELSKSVVLSGWLSRRFAHTRASWLNKERYQRSLVDDETHVRLIAFSLSPSRQAVSSLFEAEIESKTFTDYRDRIIISDIEWIFRQQWLVQQLAVVLPGNRLEIRPVPRFEWIHLAMSLLVRMLIIDRDNLHRQH